jgi:predicted nucleic acid-binding Zn ribbon protein
MLYTMTCASCASTFTVSRDDARTCSPRCRVRLHRVRDRERRSRRETALAEEISRTTALLRAMSARADMPGAD